jgi:hypothetical protein
MFWICILAIGAAMTFSALGAYSVWFKIFVFGFKLVLWIISILTLWFVWKHFFKSKTSESVG